MQCPKCRIELFEGAKFCFECGINLRDPDSSPGHIPEPSKPHLSPEPERKHVTAVFSDLSGYTSMTEKLDPEQVKEITGHIFSGVKKIIAKYEGFLERVMGDGCLAFFGVPRAHEDDPIRAIHAAMEIHEFVRQLSPKYEALIGAHLTMHSGINTGLVVTADVDPEKGTHGVAGDAVNVASRLSGMAGPGEILVGSETVRRAKGQFRFEDLGRKQAKGKVEPVRVYKVMSNSPTKVGSIDRQVSSEMVGREKELDRLAFQVMKAIHGEGSVVNVVGEPGIGKSRLIAELRKREVVRRVSFLEGRAISIGKNLSFHPIIDLLKQWAKIAEDETEIVARNKLETAIGRVCGQESAEVFPFVATMMGMKLTGKHAERIQGIEGEGLEKLIRKNVRQLLTVSAGMVPVVILMEDLHWADASSLEMLQSLYRIAKDHPVVFLNVFRQGYWDTDVCKVETIPEWLPDVQFVEIRLQPLDQWSCEELINNMLHIKGLKHPLKQKILELAGGNPFFIEEVVRSLIDEGAIVRTNGAFEVTETIDEVILPSSINDVLMARIDRLEDQTRELVKVASVIGRSFFDRILKDVAARIDDVDGRLAYLKDAQLIRDRIRMEELEYLFKHALTQEAAYESTLMQQRKNLHRRVAQSIERIFAERLHEFYGMLAMHYSRADDSDKAEEYMTRAGEEALRSSGSSEALYYYKEALRFYLEKYGDGADQEKLATFEKNIALAYFNKGNYESALKYFDKFFQRWGRRLPRNKISIFAKLAYDWLVLAKGLSLPSIRRKRIPDQRVTEFFDVAFKKDICLVHVDSERGS